MFAGYPPPGLQFDALREVVARERQGALSVVESLVGSSSTHKRIAASAIGRASVRFGERGGQLDRRRARRVPNPYAREPKARTGMFLRGKLISDHGLFSFYEGQLGAANGQDACDVLTGMHRALDGWMLSRARASPAQRLRRHEPRYYNVSYF